MFGLSKYARGLSGLLDLRSGGVGPDVLAAQIVATIDATPLYLLQGRETISIANAVVPVAVGPLFPAGTGHIVPAGQLWYVWSYNSQVNLAAGQALDYAMAFNPDGTQQFSAQLSPYSNGVALQFLSNFAVGFWAGPGSSFCSIVRSFTGAPAINFSAVVSRLRI